MQMSAADIRALDGYRGAVPRPADFDGFWAARMAEADAVPLVFEDPQDDYTKLLLGAAPSLLHPNLGQ